MSERLSIRRGYLCGGAQDKSVVRTIEVHRQNLVQRKWLREVKALHTVALFVLKELNFLYDFSPLGDH